MKLENCLINNLAKQKIIEDLLPQKFGKQGTIWVIGLLVLCSIGFYA